MYQGIVPMLSKGSFSLYYGGQDILGDLSEEMASPVTPIFVGCSVLLQLSVFSYKKFTASRLSPSFKSGWEENNTFIWFYLND